MYAARLVLGVLSIPKPTGPAESAGRGAATLLSYATALLQWRVSMCGIKLTRRGGRRGYHLARVIKDVCIRRRLANRAVLVGSCWDSGAYRDRYDPRLCGRW